MEEGWRGKNSSGTSMKLNREGHLQLVTTFWDLIPRETLLTNLTLMVVI